MAMPDGEGSSPVRSTDLRAAEAAEARFLRITLLLPVSQEVSASGAFG